MACWYNRKLVIIFILCLFSCLLLCGKTAAAQETRESKAPQQLKHIIIISVGGLNHEGFVSAPVPNMKYLATDGILAEQTLAVKADTLEAAEASLLTGTLPIFHRYLTVKDQVEMESIFELMKENGKSTLMIDGSGGKLQGFAHGEKEYVKMNSQAKSGEILDLAYKNFNARHPFFTYIYIDECSQALLKVDQKAYYQSIRNFDAQLGTLLKRLRDEGDYDESLIVITSARSSSSSNMVPLIIRGPQCKKNVTMDGALVVDVFATICHAAGLEQPITVQGIPLYSVMQATDEERYVNLQEWNKSLLQDRAYNWNKQYQLQDDLQKTIHQMNAIKEEKQSIFKFAGEREKLISGLKTKRSVERSIWIGIILFLLLGYVVEYLWLRKKFLLFK